MLAALSPVEDALRIILPALVFDFIITMHLPCQALRFGAMKLSRLTGLALPTPSIVPGPSTFKTELYDPVRSHFNHRCLIYLSAESLICDALPARMQFSYCNLFFSLRNQLSNVRVHKELPVSKIFCCSICFFFP